MHKASAASWCAVHPSFSAGLAKFDANHIANGIKRVINHRRAIPQYWVLGKPGCKVERVPPRMMKVLAGTRVKKMIEDKGQAHALKQLEGDF